MITFLHTAQVNVQRFEKLVRKYDSGIEIRHVVNEDLLRYALANGTADLSAFSQTANKIKGKDHGLIVCTCSSYGEACDQVGEIERIDRPVVEYLVKKYERIGLGFTVKSTEAISRQLIEESARNIDKTVEVIPIDCTTCWTHLEKGDPEQYAKSIADIIRNEHNACQAIFLAQASMENAKNYLTDFDKEVMGSPEYGVIHYLDKSRQIN